VPNLGSVAIVGQGYVGLPLAMEAALAGLEVVGLDVSSSRVSQLNEGISHIEDVKDEVLRSVIGSSKYRASTQGSDASGADVVVICVPTPLKGESDPDLSFVESAVRMVATHLKPNALLVSESTSYPGTVRELIKPLVESLRDDSGVGIRYASAPERVDPMNSKWNMKSTPRLVAGLTDEATELAHEFYSSFCDTVIKVSSPEVAESAKLLENTFRQVNIALMNQLVPFCRSLGIDVREVIEAAGSKPYGYMKFFPGAGVGGHCIPIDPLYLLWRSRQLGIDLPFVESADKTNREMPKYVANRLIDLAGLKSGDKALIMGVAYKAGISDVRESPANDVANHLISKGVEVFWRDPLVSEFEMGEKWDSSIAVKGAIVVTAQPDLGVESVANAGVPVLDCTGAYKGIQGVSQL
jgi:UDP-N-acetyl-D-glucosamine dehydrogenase